MDDTGQEEDYAIINTWVQTLDKFHLIPVTFPSSSFFNMYNLLSMGYVLHKVLVSLILLFVSSNRINSLRLGGIYYTLESVVGLLNLQVFAISLLTFAIDFTRLKRIKIIHEMIGEQFLSYLSCRRISVQENQWRKKFLRHMKLNYFLTKMSCNYCVYSGCLMTFYGMILNCLNEKEWLPITIWCFWGVLHCLFIIKPMCSVFWVGGLWYSLKTHLNMEVDQLIDSSTRCLNLVTPDLQVSLVRMLKSYKSLAIKIRKFNLFSKELSFSITACTTVFNAGNMYCIAMAIASREQFLAALLIVYWVTFQLGSLAVLAASSSIFKKNQLLNRILNQLYSRKSFILSRNLKHELNIMIKNTGSRNQCPLALVNIDGRIYDHQILARYVFYTVRMMSIVIRFSHNFSS